MDRIEFVNGEFKTRDPRQQRFLERHRGFGLWIFADPVAEPSKPKASSKKKPASAKKTAQPKKEETETLDVSVALADIFPDDDGLDVS